MAAWSFVQDEKNRLGMYGEVFFVVSRKLAYGEAFGNAGSRLAPRREAVSPARASAGEVIAVYLAMLAYRAVM
ncbi:hypothetical protein [Thiolapillus sp.]